MKHPSPAPKAPQKAPKKLSPIDKKLKIAWDSRTKIVAIVAGAHLGLATLLGGPTFVAPMWGGKEMTKSIEDDNKELIWSTGQYMRNDKAKSVIHDRIRAVRIDGSYVDQQGAKKGEDGGPCFLTDKAADAVEFCNATVAKETGTHMQIKHCFRSNELQSKICGSKGGSGCAGAGKSFHGSAQAIDIENFKPFEACLIDQGMMGGCATTIKEDPGHFSYGELRGDSIINALGNCGFKAAGKTLFKRLWSSEKEEEK